MAEVLLPQQTYARKDACHEEALRGKHKRPAQVVEGGKSVHELVDKDEHWL